MANYRRMPTVAAVSFLPKLLPFLKYYAYIFERIICAKILYATTDNISNLNWIYIWN